MKIKKLLSSITFAVGLSLTNGLFAQAPKVDFPAASPGCTIKQRVGLTDIEVTYSRPSMKGRSIFGADGLVPNGKVWRTGRWDHSQLHRTRDHRFRHATRPR